MKFKTLVITTFLLIFSVPLSGQQQTADGGFVIGGTTESYIHGTPYDTDFLVYKVTAAGQKQWRKNYGGGEYDNFGQVIQTSDGGYAVCGRTQSYTHGSWDFLVYRLDAAGQKLWRKNYGGADDDRGRRIVQTADGGFAVSGTSHTYTNGDQDLLVYRLDASGNKLWRKNYGGIQHEGGGYINTTSDGGFILCGSTYTYTNGDSDCLIYRLNAAGQKLWRRNYGGVNSDYGTVARETADGGFILAGYSNTYSTMSALDLVPAQYDCILYRLDDTGHKQWRRTYGGLQGDYCWDIRQTADRGFVFLGYTYCDTNGGADLLVARVDSSGHKMWRKNFGGAEYDHGYMMDATTDGGFILFGDGESYNQTGSDYDLLVYRLDPWGHKQWRKNYGGDEGEYMEGK
jgi:hypothetical protein